MVNVSAAFHSAVKNGSPQRVKIRFLEDNTTLTGANITSDGLTIVESCNEGNDLTIGHCIASEASMTLYNDDGSLSGLRYGEAEITIGVQINGAWEDASLGIFNLDAPKKRSIRVEVSGFDRMAKFDKDVSSWWSGITYPITLGSLLSSLCTEVGVSWTATAFINSTLRLTAAPLGASGLTGRDVLQWICEVACCYGRVNRSGYLELRWWNASGQTVTRVGQRSLELAEYSVPQIDRLHIITAESDLGVLVPESGTQVTPYQIVDNPFLYGDTAEAIRAIGQPIYTRLAAVPQYVPMELETTIGDWSLEAGDTATVETGTSTTETLYIFRQTIRWNGGCSITYESMGQASRLVANSETRKLFDQSWRYFKLKADIEGLAIDIGGKIDGTQCQTLVDASMRGVSMSVTSGSTGSSFSMIYNGVEISTQTLDLHVKSVNVDGTITADAINLNTATITGTLSAGNIDATNLNLSNANIGTLQVGNANIDTLYASKIVGGSTGGYISAGAISDAVNALSSLNVGALSLAAGGGNAGTITMSGANYVILGNAGVKLSASGSYTSWADIVSGATGGAVFG